MKRNSLIQRFINAAEDIALTPETPENEKAFLARQLVQVTLPHSSPGNISIWKRTNGNLTLSIRSGWDHEKDKPIGYPFGTIPRLLLFWLTTEALRTKSRKLFLGDSLAGFMREIGLNPNTGRGKRGDAKRLRDQMERLFRATISFEYHIKEQTLEGKGWLDMHVAPKGELWWDTKNPDQAELWESWIELSEDFYNAIVAAPIPVDTRVLRALKNSSLALDLYAWATYKTFIVSQKKEPQFVDWKNLMGQLGANYTDQANFKKKVKPILSRVKAVFSSFKYEIVSGGIIIQPGIPSVKHKPTKRLSKTSE